MGRLGLERLPLPTEDLHEAPWVYQDGETVVYRISVIGACSRALLAARRGYQAESAPAFMLSAAQEGHLHEADVIRQLKEQGYTVDGTQDTVSYPIGKDLVLRGHIDGRVQPPGSTVWHVLEIKSMSKDQFSLWKKKGFLHFTKYADQITVYATALKMPILYVVKDRNLGTVDITRYEEPPHAMSSLVRKVLSIEAAVEGSEWLPCERGAGWCPYPFVHDVPEVTMPERAVWEELTLNNLAQQYDQARERESAAKAEKDRFRQQLEEAMTGRTAVETAGYILTYNTRQTKTLDIPAMEKAYPGLKVEDYYKKSLTKVFSVESKNKQAKQVKSAKSAKSVKSVQSVQSAQSVNSDKPKPAK